MKYKFYLDDLDIFELWSESILKDPEEPKPSEQKEVNANKTKDTKKLNIKTIQLPDDSGYLLCVKGRLGTYIPVAEFYGYESCRMFKDAYNEIKEK